MNTQAVEQDAEALGQTAAIELAAEKSALDAIDMGVQIGRIQALQSVSTLTNRAKIEIYDRVVSSGKHINLPYRKPDGAVARTANIEDFCAIFLGRPYESLREDRQNLRLVGPEAYDQLEASGLMQRDQWRALRNAEKTEDPRLQEAIAAPEEQRVERLLVLIDQIKATQEETEKSLASAKADLNSQRERTREKSEKLDELTTRLERLERGQVPAAELVEPIINDLARIGRVAEQDMRALATLVEALDLCATNEWEKPTDLRDEQGVVTAVQRLGEQLYRLGRKLGAIQAKYELALYPLLSGRDTDLLRTAPPTVEKDPAPAEPTLRAVK